jgi:hypothetical protein
VSIHSLKEKVENKSIVEWKVKVFFLNMACYRIAWDKLLVSALIYVALLTINCVTSSEPFHAQVSQSGVQTRDQARKSIDKSDQQQAFKSPHLMVITNKISSTAKGISAVTDEFFIRKSLRFDLIICGEATSHLKDLTDEVMSKISEKTSIKLYRMPHITNCISRKIDKSVVFFTKNEELLRRFNTYHHRNPRETMKIQMDHKIVFYIEDNFSGLSDLFSSMHTKFELSKLPVGIFEFLLFNEHDELKLKAVSYFTEGKCDRPNVIQLNSMNKESGKWSEKLVSFDHFNDMHGCLVAFQNDVGPTFYAAEFKHLMKNATKTLEDVAVVKQIIVRGNLTYRGIFFDIAKTIAKEANFTTYHQFAIATHADQAYKDTFVPQNGKALYTSLIMENILFANHFHDSNYLTHHAIAPYTSIDFYYLVTPNDFYTNYEKLCFPFEKYAWICFGVMFGLTFGAIVAVDKVQRRIQSAIFGLGIDSPVYNAVSIFFGISQTKLPDENFARILLTMFLFLCLIFRTCYQSKMFEFMTTDMRKPLPETIDDLVCMNYTVVFEGDFYNTNRDIHLKIVNNRPR